MIQLDADILALIITILVASTGLLLGIWRVATNLTRLITRLERVEAKMELLTAGHVSKADLLHYLQLVKAKNPHCELPPWPGGGLHR